jgi:hypothetical protein
LQHETQHGDFRHQEIRQTDRRGERDESRPSPRKITRGELLAPALRWLSLSHPLNS